MEHRNKRQRLDVSEDPVLNSHIKTPSTETVPALSSTADESVATVLTGGKAAIPVSERPVVATSEASVEPISAAPETATETMGGTSTPLSVEVSKTPDTSTWQGWAEIENDPVCPFAQMVKLRCWAVSPNRRFAESGRLPGPVVS